MCRRCRLVLLRVSYWRHDARWRGYGLHAGRCSERRRNGYPAAGLKPGSNRRFAGEDFARAAAVVPAGTRLKPQHLAGLAAAGFARVEVRRRLKVAIFSTGNEIREPASEAPEPGCQYDANRAMLAGLLAARGMEITDLGILPDDPVIMARALKQAAGSNDAILTSGGVSTGEEDHVKAAIEAAGRLDFWRLAIKPGRPIAMGTLEGTPFLGMPGNPAAVFVTFLRFVGPVLDMLAGAQALRPRPSRSPAALITGRRRIAASMFASALRRSLGPPGGPAFPEGWRGTHLVADRCGCARGIAGRGHGNKSGRDDFRSPAAMLAGVADHPAVLRRGQGSPSRLPAVIRGERPWSQRSAMRSSDSCCRE